MSGKPLLVIRAFVIDQADIPANHASLQSLE